MLDSGKMENVNMYRKQYLTSSKINAREAHLHHKVEKGDILFNKLKLLFSSNDKFGECIKIISVNIF